MLQFIREIRRFNEKVPYLLQIDLLQLALLRIDSSTHRFVTNRFVTNHLLEAVCYKTFVTTLL